MLYCCKKYYQKNKDKIRDQVKKYVDSNKDKIKAYKKEWYQQNKDRIKENREKGLSETKTLIKKDKPSKDIIKEKIRKIKLANAAKAPKSIKTVTKAEVISQQSSIRRLSLMEEIQLVHKMRKGGHVACPNCMSSLEYLINSRDEIIADCGCGYKLNTRFS